MAPGSRAVLRRLVDVGGTASFDDVQDHFAGHPQAPIDLRRIGGTLTSIRAAGCRARPDNRFNLLERDDRRRMLSPGRTHLVRATGKDTTWRHDGDSAERHGQRDLGDDRKGHCGVPVAPG
ncbi:hypothetical protein ACGFWE_00180 [Streptomyces sp. NPDC048523]|uniref:hypothetical protein n=1 Tax=Streptomyces sp. NPDC048523 TaxID=3365567 RepID=UPI00370F8A24